MLNCVKLEACQRTRQQISPATFFDTRLNPRFSSSIAFDDVCLAISAGPYLWVLQWARAHGCPWSGGDNMCAAAAEGGCLATLQWVREREHCPWYVLTYITRAHHVIDTHIARPPYHRQCSTCFKFRTPVGIL